MTQARREEHEDAEPRREDKPRSLQKAERGDEKQDAVARLATTSLHVVENVIYVFTALLLVAGAIIVLVQAVYRLSTESPHGVTTALQSCLNSLLIVFILVELLSAVRAAIDEHLLVAEPFLLVGILAAIKEMVVIATFRLDEGKVSDAMLKIGVLGAIVIALAVATLILRRREREPREAGDR